MEGYILDWLNLLGRWVHVITGIAWIGASFYFIWLDNHLLVPRNPDDEAKGVGGEVWSVHGGGFYHAQKYKGAPAQIPEPLHWFKWEAYTTWLSGMFLLVLVYWYSADVYLIDPSVRELSIATAVGIAAAFIVGGWLVYDLLCKFLLGKSELLFAGVLLLLVTALAWSLCEIFSGRGAYIHFGAVLGTIMVANVFFVIIPGQQKMVAAATRGESPDLVHAVRAKQRSVHNTYFTLPVLFTMTSNHFSMSFGHEYNWLILVAIALVGALVRVYFVARHKGKASLVPVIVSIAILLVLAAALAPKSRAMSTATVDFSQVRSVIAARCSNCHAAQPTHPGFPAAPAGVVFDTDEQIRGEMARIHQQTVVTRVMPIGNLTNITDAERDILDAWYREHNQ